MDKEFAASRRTIEVQSVLVHVRELLAVSLPEKGLGCFVEKCWKWIHKS